MTIQAEYTDGEIQLVSDYDMRDRDRIKQMPGARYTDAKGWVVPFSWAACLQLRGIFGEELQPGPNLIAVATDLRNSRIAPALALRQQMTRVEEDEILARWRGDKNSLYPFQEAGVKFLATARTALLADEMGAGKTPQTIKTLQYLRESGHDPYPAIIVAPLTLLANWKREFEKWDPWTEVAIVKGSALQRRKILEGSKAKVFLIAYNTVRMHSRLAPYGPIRLKTCIVCDKTKVDEKLDAQSKCEKCRKELNQIAWKTIVVDECHRLKDPKAKQTRAIWSLRTADTENVFCLSGTALTEAPHDLWSTFYLLDPVAFSNKSKYLDRYCQMAFNPFGGMEVKGLNIEREQEFFGIVDPMLRRMPKEAVLPFLPKKVYLRYNLELTPAQKRQYTSMVKGMLAETEKAGYVVTDNVLTQTSRLDQIANACLEEGEGDLEGTYYMVDPSNKVNALLELLEDMGNKPLVVASASRQLIELAKKALDKAEITHSEVVGGQTPDQRDKAVQDFQGGKVRVIFCSVGAGSEGLTLTRADTVVFLQRPWKMSQSKQMEDRVHRIGSEVHDSINVIDFISVDTIEEHRLVKLADKEERLQEVMRDKDFLIELLKGEQDG